MGSVFIHCDCNYFYPHVEIQHNPKLRGKPVAVCGSAEERHGIVLSANPIAKWYQIRTGDANWQALKKCHTLVVLPPNMEKYERASRFARAIYARYSDRVMPYGLDEAWLDLTGFVSLEGALEIADEIRRLIKLEIGITISAGVSYTKTFAKLGSDVAKADCSLLITKENYKDVVWPLPAGDLLFVGPATRKDLAWYGIMTIGQLANARPDFLQQKFGVRGIDLWQTANGYGDSSIFLDDPQPDKSVGNSYTPPHDLITDEDIRVQVMVLAESISERMRVKQVKGYTLSVFIRNTELFGFERQRTLPHPIGTAKSISEVALDLIAKNRKPGEPIRKLGISMGNLIFAEAVQLSILPEIAQEQRQDDLEAAMQDLRRRFGHFSVQRAMMLVDRSLSNLDIRHGTSAQSLAFYRGVS